MTATGEELQEEEELTDQLRVFCLAATEGDCRNATARTNQLCCCTRVCARWNIRDEERSSHTPQPRGGICCDMGKPYGVVGQLKDADGRARGALWGSPGAEPHPGVAFTQHTAGGGTAAGHGPWAVMGLFWGCSRMALGLLWGS